MRKLISILALLTLLLVTSIQIFAQAATPEATPPATQEAGVPPAKPDFLTLLQADSQGRFTTLIAALNATSVGHILSGAGPFTLLAPTNDAFTALEKQTGMTQDQLLANPQTLTKILLYHVVIGQYFFRQLTSGPTLPTELAGQPVTFNLASGVFTAEGANISDADYLASNGVVDVLDAVMLPPDVAAALATPEMTAAPTEVATAAPTAAATVEAPMATEAITQATPMATPEMTAAPTEAATAEATQEAGVPPAKPDFLTLLQADSQGRFTTLIAALNATSVGHILSGAGPFTLLAPTNDAFTALEKQTGMTQDQLLANPQTLTKILLYHVVIGQYFFRQLTSGPTLPTELAGQPVTFNLASGVFTAEGANISDADYLASNGVVDVLDAVMLPPDVAAALATPEMTVAPTEVATAAPTAAATVEAPMATEAITQATPMATPEMTAAPTEAATAEATQEAGVPPAKPDFLTLLQADSQGRFTTLIAALNATSVGHILSGAGPFTLLAPTNDAFTALEKQTGMTQDQLLANPQTLTKILLYHVVIGQYFFRQLTSGPTLPTELAGQPVTFNLASGVFTAEGANISDADYLASNGVVDVLDAVMLPPDVAAALATPEMTVAPTEVATAAPTEAVTVAATAAPTEAATPEGTQEAGVPPTKPNLIAVLQADSQGRFTTLVAAIDAAGLTNTLSQGGPFTLLAPTNDAFTALEKQTGKTQDELLADTATLSKILMYHVIPGQYFFRQLTSGPSLDTLEGEKVTFNLASGVFTVQGANISDADYLASNGVFDALDAVMLPPAIEAALATPEVTAAPTEVATEAATEVATATPEATVEPTPEVTPVANGAHLRFVNLSPDAGAVNVTISGESGLKGMSFGAMGSWMSVAPGTYQIGVAPTGSSSSAQVSVDLAANDYVTIALTGSASSNTLKAGVLREDFLRLSTGSARLSVFNGVEGSKSYNVTLTGRVVVVRLGYPGTLGNNDGFYTVDVPAGTYEVRFVVDGQPKNVVIDVPNMTLSAGKNYFIAAAGPNSGPSAIVAGSDVPAAQ